VVLVQPLSSVRKTSQLALDASPPDALRGVARWPRLTLRWHALASGCVLTACLALGGGTRPGFLSDALVQLIAIPLLLASLWGAFDRLAEKSTRGALVFCGALVLVPLVQLIPLPPTIWTALPNREAEKAAFELLGTGVPWMPISVSPHATWLSALSLIPPLAIFLSVLQLSWSDRRVLCLVALAFGVLSVFVGLQQIAQGPNSLLRFFENTNASEAVGFFANRNHYAALLYASVLLAAAWAVETTVNFQRGRHVFDARTVMVAASLIVVVILVAAQTMARSRAGLGLTIVALFGAFALAFVGRRGTPGLAPGKLLVVAVVLAIIFASQFALYRVLERFSSDPLQDARITFGRLTAQAAVAYLPFGSGMGTFTTVYPALEKPADALPNTFANRAHNDFLELWLEAGIMGLALMLVFAIWLATVTLKVWRARSWGNANVDQLLARAATIIIGLIVAHSFVDYPLRTCAVMAVFAFNCSLLFAPVTQAGAETVEKVNSDVIVPQPGSGGRRAAEDNRATQPVSMTPRRPWRTDIEWPQEWQKRGKTEAKEKKPRD
jgi:O-antigen ligase